MGKEREFP